MMRDMSQKPVEADVNRKFDMSEFCCQLDMLKSTACTVYPLLVDHIKVFSLSQ